MTSQLKQGDVLLQRYEVQARFQSGTLAKIWHGYDHILKRRVLIKMMNHQVKLREGNELEFVEREAFLSASLEHPNILPIYDFGEQDGSYFLVSRAYKMTLMQALSHHQQEFSSVRLVLDLLRSIAGAIDYLHEIGNIAHANLKPHNIVLNSHDNLRWHPYLSDFGVASLGMMLGVGTPLYMAPELFIGGELTKSIDIYAFGVVMYQCLTNRIPFDLDAENWQEQKFIPASIPSVRAFKPELPIGIDVLIRQLLHPDAKERYNSATAAVDDLTHVFYSGQTMVEGSVFISYARKDQTYVHAIVKELRRIGIDIWIDQDIATGSTWDDAIQSALETADMMLLIVTEAAMQSDYVTYEWSYFMGSGKPVYPFVPRFNDDLKIHPRLGRIQHVLGSGDLLGDVARIVDVLAGGNPTKLNAFDANK